MEGKGNSPHLLKISGLERNFRNLKDKASSNRLISAGLSTQSLMRHILANYKEIIFCAFIVFVLSNVPRVLYPPRALQVPAWSISTETPHGVAGTVGIIVIPILIALASCLWQRSGHSSAHGMVIACTPINELTSPLRRTRSTHASFTRRLA
jgi:hypothetical protein